MSETFRFVRYLVLNLLFIACSLGPAGLKAYASAGDYQRWRSTASSALTKVSPKNDRAQTGVVSLSSGSDPITLARAVNGGSRGRGRSYDVELSYFWQGLQIDSGAFEVCSGDCEAQLSYHELNGNRGRELILKLTKSFNFCRYLIYRRRASGWAFVGHVDHDFNRYQMSRHRVVSFRGKPWLVVWGQEGSGTGFALYMETWYHLTEYGIRPVLTYPVEGRTVPWPSGLGKEFRATTVSSTGDRTLRIRYVVKYTTLDYVNQRFSRLFVNRHSVTLTWNQREQRFLFSRNRSTISEAEVMAIANIEEPEEQATTKIGETTFYGPNQTKQFVGSGYEVFVRHNFHRLKRIARDRTNQHREWLRGFLKDCEDSREKRELEIALAQN